MPKRRLPRSIRKYIRQEKARIRRGHFDVATQDQLIRELYLRFSPQEIPTTSPVDQKPETTSKTKDQKKGKKERVTRVRKPPPPSS